MSFSDFILKVANKPYDPDGGGEVEDFCEDIINKDILYRYEDVNSKDDILFESYQISSEGHFLQAAINAWCEFKGLRSPKQDFLYGDHSVKIENIGKKKAFLALKEELGDEVFDYFPEFKKRFSTQQRIKNNLRSRLYKCVAGGYKNPSFQYVGCSIDKLKKHLESKFTKGMTWENYGAWHIDHIRPCASYDLTIEEEIHRCFNYTNLQPLWAADNIRKGDKWDGQVNA